MINWEMYYVKSENIFSAIWLPWLKHLSTSSMWLILNWNVEITLNNRIFRESFFLERYLSYLYRDLHTYSTPTMTSLKQYQEDQMSDEWKLRATLNLTLHTVLLQSKKAWMESNFNSSIIHFPFHYIRIHPTMPMSWGKRRKNLHGG